MKPDEQRWRARAAAGLVNRLERLCIGERTHGRVAGVDYRFQRELDGRIKIEEARSIPDDWRLVSVHADAAAAIIAVLDR